MPTSSTEPGPRRQMARAITRESLAHDGISVSLDENGEIHVYHRRDFKGRSRYREIKPGIITSSSGKKYVRVAWRSRSNGWKCVTMTISRVAWAWFHGSVPSLWVVDHIDNDPLNNKMENLQALSYSDNAKKRYKDRDEFKLNQYKTWRRSDEENQKAKNI